MHFKWLFIFAILFSLTDLPAQSSYLFKVDKTFDLYVLNQLLQKDRSYAQTEVKELFPSLGIYEAYSNGRIDVEQLNSQLSQYLNLEYIHPNATISYRTSPNDSRYDDQGNMRLIQTENVWDLSTGGQTESGRELVIAIIDDGFDADHVDLVDNLWSNPTEILDGIDNDGNGFIDDINGINLSNDNGSHPPLLHGTAVAGIIGASGDNGEGIAGVNWNIKMMLLSEGFTISNVIRSYNYVYEQRRLYNESNGNQGSLVVATNFSAGIDFAKASDYPSWCAVYDQLGEVGILNVVAASNRDVNIDIDGDMPSTCPSEYLITVTDSGADDIFRNTARGKIHIDLSAPGTGTISTRVNDLYGGFGFTSGAAPYVCGAIGLLYSLDCERIEQEIVSNPAMLASAMKEAIMLGVHPISDLRDISQSGGRLDVFESSKQLSTYCDQTTVNSDALLLFSPSYNNASGTITAEYRNITNETHQIRLYDMQGRLVYADKFDPPFIGQKVLEISYRSEVGGIYVLSIASSDEIVSQKLLLLD